MKKLKREVCLSVFKSFVSLRSGLCSSPISIPSCPIPRRKSFTFTFLTFVVYNSLISRQMNTRYENVKKGKILREILLPLILNVLKTVIILNDLSDSKTSLWALSNDTHNCSGQGMLKGLRFDRACIYCTFIRFDLTQLKSSASNFTSSINIPQNQHTCLPPKK